MIIYYDWMIETWIKEDYGVPDVELISMTPENGEVLYDTFETEEEFWEWYNEE